MHEETDDAQSGASSLSLRAITKYDDQLAEESAEYYEEIIEESEEETESQPSIAKRASK